MPSFSSVRQTGRCDCSTSLMTSSFSDEGYLIRRLPHPRSCFFEQPQGERLLGDYLLQLLCLKAQVLDLLRTGRSCRIPGKPALACLKELLRPAVVQALGNPLAPAQLGNAGFAANPVQHDSDLVFSRIVLARRAADVLYKLFGRPVRCPGFLSHLRSLNGYDEPEILLSSPHRFCPMSADAGHIPDLPACLDRRLFDAVGLARITDVAFTTG